MKKLVVFIISLVVMMNCMSLAVFATENSGSEIEAKLVISSVAGASTDKNVSVNAGNSFIVKFCIAEADSYENGYAVATVSGSGFTVNGSGASRSYNISSADTVCELPIYVDPSQSSGRYTVDIIVNYSAGGKSAAPLSQTLNINVNGYSEPSLPDAEVNGDVTLRVNSAPTSAVYAGSTFNIGFESYLTANALFGYQSGTVTVSGSGFTLAGALAEQDIHTGYSTVSVLADQSLETGRHQLTLTVTYKVNGTAYTASRALNIDIQSSTEQVDEPAENAAFKLTGASIPEGKGRANLSTTLKLSFKNTSDITAEDVKIRLTNLGDLILNTYTDTADAGDVIGGQTVNATFPIKFPETIMSPQTTLTAEVTFNTSAGPQSQTFSVYLQSTVTKPDEQTPESATLTPKVIVSQYSVDVDNVTSGEQFTLTFVLENTSSEKDLRNMTVNVTPLSSNSGSSSSGPVFSFIDGTSSFYTDLLGKSGTLEYSIRLKCSASAGAGSYPINISFNYEYANGGGYSTGNGDMDINLPVVQPVKFELMEWVPPTECPVDGTYISFQYFNKSRNPMSSLAVSVEGDFEMPTQYVGTLNASSYDYFSGMITPAPDMEVGSTGTAILVFTFEDASGEEQRVESDPFEMTITEGMSYGGDDWGDDWGFGGDWGMDFPDPMGPDGMPVDGEGVDGQGGGFPLWAKIAIPSVIAVIVIVAIVVVVKKVKAKKDEDEDED